MTFKHDTSDQTPCAKGDLSAKGDMGVLPLEFVEGIGNKLSWTGFVEPVSRDLQREFGFQFPEGGTRAIARVAVIKVAQQVAKDFGSWQQADTPLLRRLMVGQLTYCSSAALLGAAAHADRHNFCRAPYFFVTAQSAFQRWAETSTATGSAGGPSVVREFLYGKRSERSAVFADPRFHAVVGRVMMQSISMRPRPTTSHEQFLRGEAVMSNFDAVLERTLSKSYSVEDDKSYERLGAYSIEQMLQANNSGYECALIVDLDPDAVSDSTWKDAWIGVAAAREADRIQRQACRLVFEVFTKLSPRVQAVCLQVYGLGRRNITAAAELKMSTGTVAGYASEIRAAFSQWKQSFGDQEASADWADKLSEVVPPEVANRLIELVCKGKLG